MKILESRYVVFDLPYPLLLRDSMNLDNTNDVANEIYVAGTPPAGIKTVLISNPANDWTARGELEGGDPYGRISHTRVQVRFHVPANSEVEDWDDDNIIQCAVDRVNILVSHYRDLANQPLLVELSKDDLVRFYLIDDKGDGNPIRRIVARGRGPLVVGIGPEQLKRENALRGRLQQAQPVGFFRELQLNTERLFYSGEYALSIIESALYFEAWLRRNLRDAYLQSGLSVTEVDAKFRGNDNQPKSIWSVAKNLIPEIYDLDFVGSEEGQNWARDAKDMRNKLVHGQIETASREQAEVSYNAVAHALTKIRNATLRA